MLLRQARERAGLSQARLAALIDSGRSTIVKLENGTLPLTWDWARRLAPALKCDPTDLFEAVPIPTVDVLEIMIQTSMREMPAGVPLGEWPHIVASSLYEQLRLYLIDRATVHHQPQG